jgi:hypothetical protein
VEKPLLETFNLALSSREKAFQLLDRRGFVRDLTLSSFGNNHDPRWNVRHSNGRIMCSRVERVVPRRTPNLNLQVVLLDHTRSLNATSGLCRSEVIRELNVILEGRRRPVAGADSGGGVFAPEAGGFIRLELPGAQRAAAWHRLPSRHHDVLH